MGSNYTLIKEVLFPASCDARWRALWQTAAANNDNAEFFVQSTAGGGIDTGGDYRGRTLPDTWHRIAVMGCIVNSPGEMADADFGYVGGAPGTINLYVGKTAVKFNIPEDEAVDRLIELIREHGKWVDAA